MDHNKFGDLKKIDMSKLTNISPLSDISKVHKQLVDKVERENAIRFAEEEDYKEAVLSALQGIEKNTGSIAEIVKLVQMSNEKQDQMIALIAEIVSISASKTKKEAESKFNNLIGKIQSMGTTVESIQTLLGLMNTIYNTVVPFLT